VAANVEKCVDITLKVRCVTAKGLPVMQKTFCKLRVKKDAGTLGAVKLLTDTTKKSTDPVFNGPLWTVSWQVPMFRSGAQSILGLLAPPVPWTLEEMTIQEQLHTMLLTLGTKAFVNEDMCRQPDNFYVRTACELMDKLASNMTDASTFEGMARDAALEAHGEGVSTQDRAMYGIIEELDEVARRAIIEQVAENPLAPWSGLAGRGHQGSMVEVAEGSKERNPIFVTAVVTAQRNDRNDYHFQRNDYHYARYDHRKTTGPTFGVLLLFFLLLLLL
jgi:hypothetical protein